MDAGDGESPPPSVKQNARKMGCTTSALRMCGGGGDRDWRADVNPVMQPEETFEQGRGWEGDKSTGLRLVDLYWDGSSALRIRGGPRCHTCVNSRRP